MINAAAAKKLNNSIISNMGLIGSTIQMARSNEPDQKAVVERIQVEQRAITSLLVSVVDYLSRLDQSLKTQSNITRLVYNQQVLSQREQATEIGTATREQPDAVPVAANDNQEEKTGSALGALASGLLIGATALLFANYKTIMDKLKSAASMLGLGAGVVAQQNTEPSSTTEDLTSPSLTDFPPPVAQAQQQPATPRPTTLPQSTGGAKPIKPAMQPGMSRPATSNPLQQSTRASKPVQQSTGGSTSARIQANRVTAPSPVSSAPVTASPAPMAPPATPIVSQKQENQATGDIPQDIVQLGKYLQGEGYRISGHSQFGGKEFGDHAPNSKHYTDNALDVNVGKGVNEATHPVYGPKLDELAAKLKKAGYSVTWKAAGHYNHLHVQKGGTSNVGTGDNEGMLGSEGFIAQSLDSVQESLSRAFEHVKPTNIMTRKIGREALQREKDIMAKPPSTGSQQGHFSKPQGARIPSPVQQSVAATGVDVTSQYMFMFFGERPQSATAGNLTQSR